MPTNEERKAVAARLRENEYSLEYFTLMEILGFDMDAEPYFDGYHRRPERLAKDMRMRLADLIEPEPVSVANITFTAEQQEELFQRVMKELRVNINLTEAVDAICGQMCGDGWDWRMRAETVVRTVAEMCGAKVVE